MKNKNSRGWACPCPNQPTDAKAKNIFLEGRGKPSPYRTYVACRNFFYKYQVSNGTNNCYKIFSVQND